MSGSAVDTHEEQLFAAALSMPSDQRANYLSRACRNDGQRHAHLMTLLRIAETARRQCMPVEQLDCYWLHEEMAEGSCSVVYRAEQMRPIRRELALKIIKIGMDSPTAISRFEAERHALSRMDHPNVARIFGAGATISGRPYFVMELIRGVKITTYCDQLYLPLHERVAVVLQVCQAIQHAHSMGFIHCDIKPSNILVTQVDGLPVVKVIDFGIARATRGRLTEEALLTAAEQFVGTPAYVSPEQTEPGGPRVDARSDIYSLGVLLYELLTGCLPFDSQSCSRSAVLQLRERIRLESPARPSDRIEQVPFNASEETSSRRGVSSAKLCQQIRGDLDWIVLRCLEKNPGLRYQTVNELYLDLSRYLTCQPVVARPHLIIHSATKFVRRRARSLALTAIILVVLGAAAATASFAAFRLNNANRVAQGLGDHLRSTVLVKDGPLMKSAVDAIHVDHMASPGLHLSYSPLARAAIHEALATSFRSLGDPGNEQLQLGAAIEILEREGGTNDVQLIKRQQVAWLVREGRYGEAEANGLPLLQQSEPGYRTIDSSFATLMAFVYFKLGKLAEVKALLEPSLHIKGIVQAAEGRTGEVLEMMAILATVYAMEGRQAEAERLAKTVSLNRQRIFGRSYPESLRARVVLANVYACGGKYAAAAGALVDAIHDQTMKSSWWQGCNCKDRPPPEVDILRPLSAEGFTIGGITDYRTSLPSPIPACRCEPLMMQHPDWGSFRAPLVMASPSAAPG